MALLFPSQTQESCAPSPCAERVLQPSREIRYQAAVSPRAIPGRKRTGKTAVSIPRPCGPGAQRVGLQTGESGGWASCGRLGAPGETRPGSPRARTSLLTHRRGAPTAAVEAVLRVPGRTRAGAVRGTARAPNAGTAGLRNLASFSYQLLFLLSQLPLRE